MTARSDRHRWFSRRLLEAMGLGSLTGVALAGAACGGNVVLDPGVGTGVGGAALAPAILARRAPRERPGPSGEEKETTRAWDQPAGRRVHRVATGSVAG